MIGQARFLASARAARSRLGERVRAPAGLHLHVLANDRETVRRREPLHRLALGLQTQPALALPVGRHPQISHQTLHFRKTQDVANRPRSPVTTYMWGCDVTQ